jgi:hypothetical protein
MKKTHGINKRTTRCRDAWFLPASERGCIRPLAALTQAGWLLEEEEKIDQALSELAPTCMRSTKAPRPEGFITVTGCSCLPRIPAPASAPPGAKSAFRRCS